MSMSAPVERAKPSWLTLYGFYVWGALLLCIVAMVRFASEHGPFAAVMLIPTAGVYGFAAYSLLHWQVGWAQKFNLGLNAVVAILGLLYMTPVGGQMPYIVYTIYSFIVVPVFAAIPGESLQAASPALVSVIGLIILGLAAYWALSWWRFVPATDGSAADLESEELSRDVRSVIRKGIIAAFILGFLALFKALSDGADGNMAWSAAAGLLLFIALVAAALTRMFPGEVALSNEEVDELLSYGSESDSDPLADDELNSDEIRHRAAMREKAKRQKSNVFNTDVTGIAFALIGIPVALVIAFIAFMVTVSDGGGVGTFLGVFAILGIAALWKVIRM